MKNKNERLQNIRQRIYRIFYRYTMIKLLGCVLVIVLLGMGVARLANLRIKAEDLPEISYEQRETQGEIEVTGSEVLVAQTESKELYLNTDTLNIRVVDLIARKEWNALRANGNNEEKSLILIEFFGEDNDVLEWDSYTYSVQNHTYTLEQIENGARINLHIQEADSYRLNEYLPQRMAIDKYEEFFLKGLDDKVADGTITEEQSEKYKDILDILYARDEINGYYYNRFSTAPPISAVSQLIEVARLLNYTTEQLIEDNAEFGISTQIEEAAEFMIPIEVTLDKDDLLVRIVTEGIETINPYFTLANIEVLPCFGSVAAQEIESGYIFVPDGSGALLAMNEFDPNYGIYSRPLYNNTYFSDYYFTPTYSETLSMPVFGMLFTQEGGTGGGFLGIIESGDEIAYINATLASTNENTGNAYNKVYTSFDTTKYEQVSILGPYDSSGGRFMAETGLMAIDYKVRYKLFSNPVTYFELAKTYKDYLIEKHNLNVSYQEGMKLYLDVIGALSLEERLLGIPYEKIVSMTDYKELDEIMRDWAGSSIVVNYNGVFNGGVDHTVMNEVNMTSVNGSQKELQDLMDTAEGLGIELYFQADFSKIYKDSNGSKKEMHALYNFDDKPVEIFSYDYAQGILKEDSNSYYLINPIYLSSVVDGFLKDAGEYNKLTIGDLANQYYANYSKGNIVSPIQAQVIVNKNLEKIGENRSIVLVNPNIDMIRYGTYATDVSRESSGFGAFDVEIPFRQLVMNGLIEYTTVNVNETGLSEDYFLLQAVELGSYPKYTLTYKNIDVLKNTNHGDFVSREYQTLQDEIKFMYQRYQEAYEQIQSREIINHQILEQNVFETTYANGVRVVTNYNQMPVIIQNVEIPAWGFQIIQ